MNKYFWNKNTGKLFRNLLQKYFVKYLKNWFWYAETRVKASYSVCLTSLRKCTNWQMNMCGISPNNIYFTTFTTTSRNKYFCVIFTSGFSRSLYWVMDNGYGHLISNYKNGNYACHYEIHILIIILND